MTRAFFVIGPAGSGKSTVSRLLADRGGAVYLDKDSIATPFTEAILRLAGDDPNARDNSDTYRDTVMELEYAAMFAVARDNLALRRDVVLDAPFLRYFPQADYLDRVAAEHGWPDGVCRVVVQVVADGAAVRERLTRRGYSRDGWKLAHWDRFWGSALAQACRWHGLRISVDNSGDEPDLAALERAISRAEPLPRA